MSEATALDRLPVDRFREAFLRSGLTLSDVAKQLDWRKGGAGGFDNSRVGRLLGIRDRCSGGERYVQKTISYENAVLLVRAMGFDPVDFDI